MPTTTDVARAMMGHYTKLSVLVMRSLGLMILAYALPVVLFGIVRVAAGGRTPSDGVTGASALSGWMAYGLAGVLLILLARPLARIAARGLDEGEIRSPAA
ncbi:MAG TPA: hypothetical protein VFZ21_22455 [Gemmatimonadaceae bacterium]|nr:hypothetical protein [Gemmatimonadaceae bacterium]